MTGLDATIARALIAALQAALTQGDAAQTGGE